MTRAWGGSTSTSTSGSTSSDSAIISELEDNGIFYFGDTETFSEGDVRFIKDDVTLKGQRYEDGEWVDKSKLISNSLHTDKFVCSGLFKGLFTEGDPMIRDSNISDNFIVAGDYNHTLDLASNGKVNLLQCDNTVDTPTEMEIQGTNDNTFTGTLLEYSHSPTVLSKITKFELDVQSPIEGTTNIRWSVHTDEERTEANCVYNSCTQFDFDRGAGTELDLSDGVMDLTDTPVYFKDFDGTSLYFKMQSEDAVTLGGTYDEDSVFHPYINGWMYTAERKYVATEDWVEAIPTDITVNGLTVGQGLNEGYGCTALGTNSLASNTDGNYNTAVGYNALTTVTEGSSNTAIGRYALKSLTDSGSNTAIGANAGESITTGDDNVAIGAGSLSDSQNGYANVVIGRSSGASISSGYKNVGVGYQSLYDLTTGDGNAVLGYQAFANNTLGGYNTGIGYQPGYFTTTASYNIGVGYRPLYNNKIGMYNTGIGYQALYYCTEGANNVALGRRALYHLTEADYNVAIGYEAANEITTGTNNVAVGTSSLLVNTIGENNVAIGDNSLMASTLGNYNTCVGSSAGSTIVDGANNICLGYNAQPSMDIAEGECTLGSSSITSLRCNVTSITSLSDIRDKTDIIESPFGLDFLNQVEVIDYLWETREGNAKDGTREVGYSAQALIALMDKYDNGRDLQLATDTVPERLEADYNKMGVVTVKAVQELSAKHDALESIVEAQATLITELSARLDALEL